MEIHFEDKQDLILVNQASLKEFISKVLFHFVKDQVDEIALYLISNEEMIQLHKDFFNDPSETDCISFPIDAIGSRECYLGEIFVSTKAALDYCSDHPHQPVGKELALYTLHGILHLLGYDDIEKEDQEVMRIKENEALGLFNEEFWSQLIQHD